MKTSYFISGFVSAVALFILISIHSAKHDTPTKSSSAPVTTANPYKDVTCGIEQKVDIFQYSNMEYVIITSVWCGKPRTPVFTLEYNKCRFCHAIEDTSAAMKEECQKALVVQYKAQHAIDSLKLIFDKRH